MADAPEAREPGGRVSLETCTKCGRAILGRVVWRFVSFGLKPFHVVCAQPEARHHGVIVH